VNESGLGWIYYISKIAQDISIIGHACALSLSPIPEKACHFFTYMDVLGFQLTSQVIFA
jgi:hypothetical protein